MDTREPVGERRWSVAGVPGGEQFADRLRYGPATPHLLIRGAGTRLAQPLCSGGWLVVTVGVDSVAIGPYFQGNEPPCWQCFRDWDLEDSLGTASTVPATAEVFVQKALDRPRGFLGRIEMIPTRTLHRVLRRPQCPNCGDPSLAVPVGFPVVRPTIDTVGVDLERFVDPVTGVIAGIDCYRGAAGFVAAAARFHPPGRREIVHRAFGSGVSTKQARVTAIAESLERYSLYAQGNEARVRAVFADVQHLAVSPLALNQFSERQYSDSAEIPARYDGQEMEWAVGWSLMHECPRLLPFAHCYWGRMGWSAPDSIGCAAGRSSGEAILRGLLELIERDALAIWWYNRVRRPAIAESEYVGDAVLRAPLRTIAGLGRDVVAFDLATDLGVPVVGAISWDGRGRRPDFGFAAALDGWTALRRAILELAQTAVGNHAERQMPPEGAFQSWRAAVRRDKEDFLRPKGVVPIPTAAMPDLLPLIAHLGEIGLEAIALDQTRPEIGVPVFRVVCPGLRHPWMRLAPGRLYDVPVALGWIPRRNREEDMNPIPFDL